MSALNPRPNATTRRIAAIFLPQLLLEMGPLAKNRDAIPSSQHATVAIQLEPSELSARPDALIQAANDEAARYGVRRGQTLSSAHSLLARLRVVEVSRVDAEAHLLGLAESLGRFGLTVSCKASHGSALIWLDMSGIAHLHGGEEALGQTLVEETWQLGHRAHVAIAEGPRLAEAFARTSNKQLLVIPKEESALRMKELPLEALGLSKERILWFSKLGLLSIEDLLSLPESTLQSRLSSPKKSGKTGGTQERDDPGFLLRLARGQDDTPLIPCVFPSEIELKIEWDEPASGTEPLIFSLHGLLSRLESRLLGRGEATTHLRLILHHDRAIARHLGVNPTSIFDYELSAPLYRQVELKRVIQGRLERASLQAPTLGISLIAKDLTEPPQVQLALAEESGSEQLRRLELPLLLAELNAELGASRLGLLSVLDSHLPEKRSALVPITSGKKPKSSSSDSSSLHALDRVTRLLSAPFQLPVPLKLGEEFLFGSQLFSITGVLHAERLEQVEWWTPSGSQRDYFWGCLTSLTGTAEALFYVDRVTQNAFLQALV